MSNRVNVGYLYWAVIPTKVGTHNRNEDGHSHAAWPYFLQFNLYGSRLSSG